MSPRVPIRLLTIVLLLLAVLEVVLAQIGWLFLAAVLAGAALGGLLGWLGIVIRETRVRYGVSLHELGPNVAPRSILADADTDTSDLSADGAPAALPAASAARRASPKWVPEAASTVSRFAAILLVVTSVMTLRTVLVLEILAQ